jgi:hypothetical protein
MLGLGPTSRYCRGIGWESLLRAQERYMKNEQSSGRTNQYLLWRLQSGPPFEYEIHITSKVLG